MVPSVVCLVPAYCLPSPLTHSRSLPRLPHSGTRQAYLCPSTDSAIYAPRQASSALSSTACLPAYLPGSARRRSYGLLACLRCPPLGDHCKALESPRSTRNGGVRYCLTLPTACQHCLACQHCQRHPEPLAHTACQCQGLNRYCDVSHKHLTLQSVVWYTRAGVRGHGHGSWRGAQQVRHRPPKKGQHRKYPPATPDFWVGSKNRPGSAEHKSSYTYINIFFIYYYIHIEIDSLSTHIFTFTTPISAPNA